MNKIIDTIMYSGENDLLEIRLQTLKEIVDETIILESNFSHTGIKKQLFFPDNKERFSEFNIKYIVRDFHHDNPFVVDWAGRNFLFEEVKDCKYLIHGDLDEIPNPDKLREILDNLIEPICLSGDYFFWCVDLWGRESNDAIILRPEWVRDKNNFYQLRDARNKDIFKKVKNASYHYSSVGTPEQIARKWAYFAHANEVNNKYKDPEYIKKQIIRKAGSWSDEAKDDELKLVEHSYPNLPKYLLENKKRFEHLFYSFYNK